MSKFRFMGENIVRRTYLHVHDERQASKRDILPKTVRMHICSILFLRMQHIACNDRNHNDEGMNIDSIHGTHGTLGCPVEFQRLKFVPNHAAGVPFFIACKTETIDIEFPVDPGTALVCDVPVEKIARRSCCSCRY